MLGAAALLSADRAADYKAAELHPSGQRTVRCGRPKRPGYTLCTKCYLALSPKERYRQVEPPTLIALIYVDSLEILDQEQDRNSVRKGDSDEYDS